MDLVELFESLILPLEVPTGNSFSAAGIPGSKNHRLGKDSNGSPCLLLCQSESSTPSAPIRLQNLMVSYGVQCVIKQAAGHYEEGIFTIIKCSGAEPSLYPHFLRILSPVVMALGPEPTSAAIRQAVSGLVALFQALTMPAKKSIQGLWAELLLIRNSTDPQELIAAWHHLPQEHVDFLSGRQRIEIKSTSTRHRAHHFSLNQLTPPAGSQLIVASIFVEPVGGGLSLKRLFQEIRNILFSSPVVLTKFDSVFYDTLGAGWSDAMEECFDEELANESLRFFDAEDIPKVDADLPIGVSDVRFISDISASTSVSPTILTSHRGIFAAVVPKDAFK